MILDLVLSTKTSRPGDAMVSSAIIPKIYGNCPVPLKRLLIQWHKELADATEQLKPYKDLPYWYIERTNVGFVAQAARQLGLTVLEEYSVLRGKGGGKTAGRADLWIAEQSGAEFEFEFKQYWPSIKVVPNTLTNNVEWYLGHAGSQLTEIVNVLGRSPRKIAMVFVIPAVAKSDVRDWRNKLKPFLKLIASPKAIGAEFSAVFEAPEALMDDPGYTTGGLLYPTVALVGKVI